MIRGAVPPVPPAAQAARASRRGKERVMTKLLAAQRNNEYGGSCDGSCWRTALRIQEQTVSPRHPPRCVSVLVVCCLRRKLGEPLSNVEIVGDVGVSGGLSKYAIVTSRRRRVDYPRQQFSESSSLGGREPDENVLGRCVCQYAGLRKCCPTRIGQAEVV
jgi:hypothetical protein